MSQTGSPRPGVPPSPPAPGHDGGLPPATKTEEAARRDGGADAISYHGQAILKPPVWTWEIPTYFFAGGLAGASAGLAYLSELRGEDELARRAWAVALAGIGVSPVLLISDLGRPARFLNMLRMFKPTSPMSVGSWVLSVSGAATSAAGLSALTGRYEPVRTVAGPVAALSGLPLSTYTAALIANTAIPAWHGARRELPFVFGAGAALSAGGAAAAVTPPAHAGAARRLALGAAVAEIVSKQAMERRLGELGEPYHKGPAAIFSRLGDAAVVAGAGLLARRGTQSRPLAAVGGSLLVAGAFLARWSIYKAGFRSAGDPRYVVEPQRARAGRSQTAGVRSGGV